MHVAKKVRDALFCERDRCQLQSSSQLNGMVPLPENQNHCSLHSAVCASMIPPWNRVPTFLCPATSGHTQTLRPSEAWFTEPCRAYFSRGKQTTFNFRITLKRNVLNSNNRGTTRKISVVIVPLISIITMNCRVIISSPYRNHCEHHKVISNHFKSLHINIPV